MMAAEGGLVMLEVVIALEAGRAVVLVPVEAALKVPGLEAARVAAVVESAMVVGKMLSILS